MSVWVIPVAHLAVTRCTKVVLTATSLMLTMLQLSAAACPALSVTNFAFKVTQMGVN